MFAHLSKLLVGFLLLKLVSFYLGAEGLGRLGHFMSLLTILSILAGGGILNGVIKYAAEYRNQPFKLVGFVSSAASYSLIFSLLLFVLGVIFSQPIAGVIFGDAQLYPYIIVLALAQVGFSFTNLIIGVCNGVGQNHIYAKIQIIGSLLALPLCWALVANGGLKGAIVGLVCSLLATVFPAFFYSFKTKLSRLVRLSVRGDHDFRKLFRYTLMLLASAIAFPLVEILVRQHLIVMSGYQEAGVWQAATRLSSAYTGLFSVALAYWFVPIISAEKNWLKIHYKTMRILFFVMAVFASGAVVFYWWRSFFIVLLLSHDFNGLLNIIHFQLLGDFFKIGSYVIGFVAVAKAAAKLYIFAELAQSLLFVFFAVCLERNYFGAQGVMMGYAVTYFIYFMACLVVFLVCSRRFCKRGVID
ncbi:O-antigen translocase [Stutzerimonas nitrititolerans]|uniref:O-antigen translocase n=1 Tax=Stutzerimonas nitrititolerans TaxID=2482751 RepID=UPI001F0C54EC|nr:O-antigen translocase [Stutzerimonas nitrititolerans]